KRGGAGTSRPSRTSPSSRNREHISRHCGGPSGVRAQRCEPSRRLKRVHATPPSPAGRGAPPTLSAGAPFDPRGPLLRKNFFSDNPPKGGNGNFAVAHAVTRKGC